MADTFGSTTSSNIPLKIVDELDCVKRYVRALIMAAEGLDDDRERDALQQVCNQAEKTILNAQSLASTLLSHKVSP